MRTASMYLVVHERGRSPWQIDEIEAAPIIFLHIYLYMPVYINTCMHISSLCVVCVLVSPLFYKPSVNKINAYSPCVPGRS